MAGENEAQPDRARALAGVSKDMENLYHEAYVMLLSKSKMTGDQLAQEVTLFIQLISGRFA